MNPESSNPIHLERLAVELAQGAAELVRRGRSDGLSIDVKSTDTDLVTHLDRASERWLVAELARRRPDDSVLGEEGASRRGTSGVRWILDPIDGTVNFVLGIPQYAVSVAAEADGVVVAGAVCNPASGELFRAHLGGGAFLGDQRLSGPRQVPLARAVIGTGFGYDRRRRERQAAVVAALVPRVADVRRLGSAALDLCFVAAGRLDGHFEAGLNPWDYAAGGLIATESGCLSSGLRGRPAGTDFYAVTGRDLAAELFGELEVLGADEVMSAQGSAGRAD